jgi:hypothetical protein
MKRILLSLVFMLLAATSTFAADRWQAFSNADIKGSYGLLAQGTSADPGAQISFPAVYVGVVSSDGNGNLRGNGTINPGGPLSGFTPGQAVTLTGTYSIDTNGTGNVTGSGAAANDPPSVLGAGALVIESSNRIQVVSTQTDRVFYTTLIKQRPPFGGFSNAMLRGAWGFACRGTLVTAAGDPVTVVESAVAVVGLMTNDGHGNFSAEDTANTNGAVSQESFTGLNKVAGDGTISATATSTNPVLANLVGIIDNSDEFRMITIDPGTIVSCTFNTQARNTQARADVEDR